jgi:hypothetical protein
MNESRDERSLNDPAVQDNPPSCGPMSNWTGPARPAAPR